MGRAAATRRAFSGAAPQALLPLYRFPRTPGIPAFEHTAVCFPASATTLPAQTTQPKQPPPRRPLPLQTPPDLHTSSTISIQGHKAKSLQNHCKSACVSFPYLSPNCCHLNVMDVCVPLTEQGLLLKNGKKQQSILLTCNCTVLYCTFCTILSFNLKYLYFF